MWVRRHDGRCRNVKAGERNPEQLKAAALRALRQ
jgi:hypothetical protein